MDPVARIRGSDLPVCKIVSRRVGQSAPIATGGEDIGWRNAGERIGAACGNGLRRLRGCDLRIGTERPRLRNRDRGDGNRLGRCCGNGRRNGFSFGLRFRVCRQQSSKNIVTSARCSGRNLRRSAGVSVSSSASTFGLKPKNLRADWRASSCRWRQFVRLEGRRRRFPLFEIGLRQRKACKRTAVARQMHGAAVREHPGELLARHARPHAAHCRRRYARRATRRSDKNRRRRAAGACRLREVCPAGRREQRNPSPCPACAGSAAQRRSSAKRSIALVLGERYDETMWTALSGPNSCTTSQTASKSCGSMVVTSSLRQSRRK